ncbi:N-formylglutamate amidohydrolase [Pontibacter beigongshangensis]|uniref:N-formylglutamate amidohydrolase n=1 Tax=Pontibacter beigongshangensis TaxID=2574733 RepID=UPI001650C2F6|nr:N-formylglutamate amidohydrolase [Pontibacter beigongshangensis]
MNVFNLQKPVGTSAPVILSIPHCGTQIPEDLLQEYKPELLPPDDTDWQVDQLYAFALELGIPVISSVFSRWVIDLNRNPDNAPLYHDGRIITDLCPCTDFLGRPIYRDERSQPSHPERERRLKLYFEPYHLKIQELLDTTKAQYGKVLLWDCHSIRRVVKTISREPFPDLILGTADGASAPPFVVAAAAERLSSAGFALSLNHPFKGGYITRQYGQPALQQYALQLEMPKDLYMDASEMKYDASKAAKVQALLRKTLTALISLLS